MTRLFFWSLMKTDDQISGALGREKNGEYREQSIYYPRKAGVRQSSEEN